ncbi:hypothetical protein RFI_02776 [Reticulomyxa filosa]|uniref:Uncharacterized protein n=1 Tax=Reticulomyxa filosa TaxID=46433 RepID=X6P875_RETFI|nr:hypothetical protein RFI_02776 [Reticulomyxa filosa]|eukprot:ETO34318.1 hypothetical protein RFI_02776 [Reticulomyxa filosa]
MMKEKCGDILSKGGLDIVLAVIHATQGDVAIQMSCCAACVILCAHPARKQYAATVNGVLYLYQGIQGHISYCPFVILAFNAVLSQILKGISYHRGKDEGSRVHSAGCLALRNTAADPKGQDTTLLLSLDQGIDLLVKILKKSDVDSILFLNH